MKKLQADFYAGKEAARHAWSVDVSRVACRSFVEIVLKSVEHILYTCIDLHRIDVIDRKIIGQAASHLEEGGCLKAPAFVFTFIDALARAGVLGGIPKARAVEIVAQTVLGSTRTMQIKTAARANGGAGRTPADLVDAVCSPSGTTVAGLVTIERAGFSNAVIEAVRAVVAADRDLAG